MIVQLQTSLRLVSSSSPEPQQRDGEAGGGGGGHRDQHRVRGGQRSHQPRPRPRHCREGGETGQAVGQGAAAALAAGQHGEGDDEDAAAGAEVGADVVVDGGDEHEEGGDGPGGDELHQQEAVHSPREVPPDRLVLEPGESLGHGAVIQTPA